MLFLPLRTSRSGQVVEAPDETWRGIQMALAQRGRGLRGPRSLAQLLATHRDVRRSWLASRLTVKQICSWIRAHKKRTGRWPTVGSGPIWEAPEETWLRIDTALRHGYRGLRIRCSLAQLKVRLTRSSLLTATMLDLRPRVRQNRPMSYLALPEPARVQAGFHSSHQEES